MAFTMAYFPNRNWRVGQGIWEPGNPREASGVRVSSRASRTDCFLHTLLVVPNSGDRGATYLHLREGLLRIKKENPAQLCDIHFSM